MKIQSVVLSVLLLGASLFASEHKTEEHEKEKSNYVSVKGMYTFGDNYTNDGIEEEGQDGYGIAIDLGHRIGYGFVTELDFSYDKSDVVVREENGESLTESADYYTISLDIAYVYEITHTIGVLAKVGYEYEYEVIADESSNDTGFIFAVGGEYSLNHTYKLLLEYEVSTIEGPKGDMVYAGLMYNF